MTESTQVVAYENTAGSETTQTPQEKLESWLPRVAADYDGNLCVTCPLCRDAEYPEAHLGLADFQGGATVAHIDHVVSVHQQTPGHLARAEAAGVTEERCNGYGKTCATHYSAGSAG